MRPLNVLDLFSGLEGWSTVFRENGHYVISVDLDERFEADLHRDVMDFSPLDLPEGWKPDVILASPPCEKFSVLRIGRNWHKDHTPRNKDSWRAQRLVRTMVDLIEDLDPTYWIAENPLGKLRRLRTGLERYPRASVTYCQYGAPWRKPTDLWGVFPRSLRFRPMCSQGATCHVGAPRGSTTGIQSDTSIKDPKVQEWFDRVQRSGRMNAYKAQVRDIVGSSSGRIVAAYRAKIPEELANDVYEAVIADGVETRLFA